MGWSHRRLIARYRDAVGLPPKLVARIVRFERLTALLTRAPAIDWAGAAIACGYFDQAHLAREVRELADITPTELRAQTVNSVQDGAARRPSVAAMTETLTINGAVPIVPFTESACRHRLAREGVRGRRDRWSPPEADQPLKHAEVKVGNGLVMIDDADCDDSPFALPGPVLLYVWSTTPTPFTTARSRRAPRSSWA